MKKKAMYLGIIILLSILTTIFVYHDDFLYSKEIMKITEIETDKIDESQNPLGLTEKYYNRKITGMITNGKNKGKKVTISYEESYSSVVTEKYHVHDKVFISSNDIDGLKRDGHITILISIFIILIFLVGEYNGLLSVFSVLLNFLIFYFGLSLYFKGIHILFLCMIESILFTILSLSIAGGINKKTVSAICSVLTSVLILFILTTIVIWKTDYDGINFNGMSFLTIPAEKIFLPELLIGSLGAIMDVAITISSSIAELIEKDSNISIKNLNQSAKQIGKDIMSTMMSVLFFTYLCGGLPIFVLAIRNGFTMYNYITSNFTLELTRFLVGSIGIVMTIPVSTFISIQIFKRGVKSE